jgi:hypothetical protein
VVGVEHDMVPAGMSHDEVTGLLAAYAAGTLGDDEGRRVRAHLASGCAHCLASLYDAPVGAARPTGPPEAKARSSNSARSIAVGLTLVVAGALAAGLVVRERQLRRTTVGETLARVQEAMDQQAALRDRLLVAKTVLRSQRRVADAEQEVLARGAEEVAGEAARLRDELRAGRRRLARLEAELAGGRLSDELVAKEGLELRALRPAPPFESVSGHVLWRPADGEMIVYAFGLPAAPGALYEARVIAGTGRVLSRRLARRRDGRAFAYLVLPAAERSVHAVEVRRVNDARRLLIADAHP